MNLIEDAINSVIGRQELTAEQAYALMNSIMQGDATQAQIAGLLVGLRMKGETADEIAGFAKAMREHAVPVPHGSKNVVDTCGTGGDSVKTFNLSTAAAIVAAASGVRIAKHGNRAFTSSCGSADILEAVGVNVDVSPEKSGKLVDDVGLAFLFAPSHHPAMKFAGPVRRELKLRTVFNLLGPLTNPAGAKRQLIGVYSPDVIDKMARALLTLGCEKGVIAHGMIGMDEIAPIGETKIKIIENGELIDESVKPEDFGIAPPPLDEITCPGGIEDAVRKLTVALRDPDSSEARAVLPSAAFAIWLGGVAESPSSGAAIAKEAIRSGAAVEKLREFVARSNDN